SEFTEMFTITPYRPSLLNDWNTVLSQSLNGTFMHRRSYMEYHGDRFSDFSLIIYKKSRPVAILPAHRQDTDLYSHLGLSYGGPVIVRLSVDSIFQMFKCLLAYCRDSDINT